MRYRRHQPTERPTVPLRRVRGSMKDVRQEIIATYAEWTAMSALRSGAPIKSRRDVYTAIRGVEFAVLFDDTLGPINRSTFDSWHEAAVRGLIERQPRLNVGWATKIVNV